MRRQILKLTFGLAITAFVLLAVEIASYGFGTAPGPCDPLISQSARGWSESRAYDPLLFWRLKPRITTSRMTTNNLGLRGPDVPDAKKGEFRVLSLGESTTFGANVAYTDCYSYLIERDIGRISDTNVRIINCGVPGYSIVQGYAFLKHLGLSMNPDAILLYFGFNDFLPTGHRARRDAADTATNESRPDLEILTSREHPFERMRSWLREHSNAYRHLSSLSSTKELNETTTELESDRRASQRVPEAHRIEILKRILGICRDNSIHLTIAIPWYKSFRDHAPVLRDFAREHRVPVIDLPNLLEHIPTSMIDDCFLDEVHPSALGHSLIASTALPRLRTEWSTQH